MYDAFGWVVEEHTMSVGVYILIELLNAVMAAVKVGLCGLALVLPARMVMRKRTTKKCR